MRSAHSRLFGVEPNKRREGYANFAIAEPPLNLVLIQNPGAAGALNHLGVELANTDDVAAIASRLVDTGLKIRSTEQEKCCHAVQDKVYVTAPEVPLDQWEFYTVLDDNPDDHGSMTPRRAARPHRQSASRAQGSHADQSSTVCCVRSS
jgi:hypothetical protein